LKRHALYRVILLIATLDTTFSLPVLAQGGEGTQLEEVLVTARRREERLQDVPISMTVFNQEQIRNANIVTAADLARYTPSMQVNSRFGDDSTNFAIRGFSQELRTTASVGVYFADVIAPRGANISQSGDGAGPGDFFDLANVQVLKGPQGTLFGRNTTGGAVLITPRKPDSEREGHLEVSAGNFDMQRVEGVVNIPVSSAFRARLGLDSQKRDGYLNNISDIGPGEFADLDYTSFRASAVWDITERMENYTILKYTESSNNGAPFSVFACNPVSIFAAFCEADLAAREAAGKNDEYDVYGYEPESESELEQSQIINTTTWQFNDDLIAKNILSYAQFESRQNMALYGTDWRVPPGPGGQQVQLQAINARDFPLTDQETVVEELQLQGTSFEQRLTWQAGLYYEKSEPSGTYGSQNPAMISCDLSTVVSKDINDWRCNDLLAAALYVQLGASPLDPVPFTVGSGMRAPGGVTYENKAIYAQGSYDLADQWSLTAGLRYTDDDTEGWTTETVHYFPGSVLGGYFPARASATESRTPQTQSAEPTWLLGLEHTPTDELMLYGKYARGYRQGSVNLASLAGWDTHEPEQVDSYEIGAKIAFEGRFPGTFNIAAFYNDFRDQQLQFGYYRTNGVGTTSILNAGASTIQGLEADGNILLTPDINLSFSYAYLDTEVDELVVPMPAEYPPGVAAFSGTTAAEGEPLPYTPENQLLISASYHVPVDDALGDLTATITYVYVDDMQAVAKATSPLAVLPSYELVDFSLNWQGIAGTPVDTALFATNLFDEEYRTVVAGNWDSLGLEVGRVGKPRMYGMRLRYNF
jgi:iron complex outermembrane receptor protein